MGNLNKKFYSDCVKQHWVEIYFGGMSYPEDQIISISVIYKVIQKFKKTGSVKNIKPTGRPLSATNRDNTENV
jgi:transposase